MKMEIIPGFSALEFKEKAQARVQAELADLPAEERVRRLNEMTTEGPGTALVRRCREARIRQLREEIERLERQGEEIAA
jgi:hypothetical protein